MFFKNKKRILGHISGEQFNFLVVNNQTNLPIIEHATTLPIYTKDFPQFIKENQLEKTTIELVVGGKQVFSRVIVLPDISEEEISQVLKWEVCKYVPISRDNILFDYEILDKITDSPGSKWRVLLIASRRLWIEDYCVWFEKLGLVPSLIEIEGSILKYLYLTMMKDRNSACCIYVEKNRAVMSFLFNKNLFYIHNIELEQILVSNLKNEFERVSGYLKRQFSIFPPDNISLFGPQVDNTLQILLQKELSMEVNVFNLNDHDFFVTNQVIDPQFTFALGLLVREESYGH